MNTIPNEQDGKRIPWEHCESFIIDLLTACGADEKESKIIADHVCWASSILRDMHGINSIPLQLERLNRGLINSPCELTFTHNSPAIAHLNGRNGFGQFVSHHAMEYALQLAEEYGIGAVSVAGSNWNGCGAYYVNMAAQNGMIGFCTSNSVPKVAAHGSSKPNFGTNPLAFGAPRENSEPILIDMATSAASGSMIRNWLENDIAISDNLARVNQDDPGAEPVLLPLGGAKGFALAMMVEVLSSVISGAGITHEVRSMRKDFIRPGNNGHFFLAVNISSLMPLTSYHQRIEQLISTLLQTDDNIKIPGEIRWQEFKISQQKGIFIDNKTLELLNNLAAQKSSVRPLFERG